MLTKNTHSVLISGLINIFKFIFPLFIFCGVYLIPIEKANGLDQVYEMVDQNVISELILLKKEGPSNLKIEIDINGDKLDKEEQLQAENILIDSKLVNDIKIKGNKIIISFKIEHLNELTGLKMLIKKPFGVNISGNIEDPLRNWQEKYFEFEFNVNNPSIFIKKIPDYNLYYIEMSSIKKIGELVDLLSTRLNNHFYKEWPFLLYVSNLSRPYIAKDGTEYLDVLRMMSQINALLPNPNRDLENFRETINRNEYVPERRPINYNFIISEEFYNLFISSIDQMMLNIYRSTSNLERTEINCTIFHEFPVTKSNNYNYEKF